MSLSITEEDDRAVLRLLTRLARPGAMLAPDPNGPGFALYPAQDRRRRPLARVSAAFVDRLAGEGALLLKARDIYVLTPAGRARCGRAMAAPEEAWRSQHTPVLERAVVDAAGDIRAARGVAASEALKLSRIRDADGRAFFNAEELSAAARIAADWAAGQEGLLRGSDWGAPPRGATPRAVGGVEAARAATVDARARVEAALAALTPAAAQLVKAACFDQLGLEAIERKAHWPARSAKVALKFALAELARVYRR
jgi:hypothetical protein